MLGDDITNCKQNMKSVLEYYGWLSKLWEELQNVTTATMCTCYASSAIEKEREDARIHKFFAIIRPQVIDERIPSRSKFSILSCCTS